MNNNKKRRSRLGIILCFFILQACLLPTALAQGPGVIAKIDRHLWTGSINTQSGFDRASRASILVYALELQDRKAAEIAGLDRLAVKNFLDRELSLSLRNYQLAAKSCTANDWTCASTVSTSAELIARASALAIPPTLPNWRTSIKKFADDYIGEQVRLAAVFSKTSSEIDVFNSNEWNGEKLDDRRFFLTFDDGPTSPDGNTDGVLEMLAANNKTAVFFVLGKIFQDRVNKSGSAKLASRYQGQCVASHGWEHLSHEKRSKYAIGTEWQTSITKTESLLKATFSNARDIMPMFRPPYGQRKSDSGPFFQEHGLQVALWNLDSQDWNGQMNAEDVIDRILTLMLIKRHGVLLFHDIHPKAARALPIIVKELGNAVEWGDCHQIGGSPGIALDRRPIKFHMDTDLTIFVLGSRLYD